MVILAGNGGMTLPHGTCKGISRKKQGRYDQSLPTKSNWILTNNYCRYPFGMENRRIFGNIL
jgi:hypothetical protein